MDSAQDLRHLSPEKEFFIAVDSDGCVFDTMEIKHKECFCPLTIKHYGLQAVSKYAREAWEFVNLYSKRRGVNRFPALVAVLDLLHRREVVIGRKRDIPVLPRLRAWIESETKLGNLVLRRVATETGDEELLRILAWSDAVNNAIGDLVYGIPPFSKVISSLEKANTRADMIVASGTPFEALEREWTEHGLIQFVRVIAGQEAGSKTEHLTLAAMGSYPPEKMLMIGDAYGDLRAAQSVGALFYPILPGHEEASWQRFFDEALDRFFAQRYVGSYQESLVAELDRALPEMPPWEVAG